MIDPNITNLGDDDCPDPIKKFIRDTPDFVIQQYIQRGAVGEVYFGMRKKLGDSVALKFYDGSPDFNASEEAVILRQIDDKNVLKVYDLRFIEPNYPCLISPLISGGDLQGFIDSSIISSKKALEICAGILKGITCLHTQHNLVHRDLKSGNILIDKDTFHPFVADLGSVKKIPHADAGVGTSKATRIYLPYESIIDSEYYIQSDIYQVGLILFQMLRGHFPLNDPLEWLTPREKKILSKISNSVQKNLKLYELIDEKICNGKIADRGSLPNYLDPMFKRTLNKALNLDRKSRFRSAPEFLKAVHDLLRYNPSYTKSGNSLLVEHADGTSYQIEETRNDLFSLWKKSTNGQWRKNNMHNGEFNAIIEIARKP